MSGTPDFRTALTDLTGDRPVPVGLADHAIAAAHRGRRRDRMLGGTAAIALVATLAVTVPALRQHPGGAAASPAGSLSTTPKPHRVLTIPTHSVVPSPVPLCRPGNPGHLPQPPAGNVAVLSYEMHTVDRGDPWYGWDPRAGTYIKTGRSVRPSPDGQWGLVSDGTLVNGVYHDGFAIAPWTDAIHGRNLHHFPGYTAAWAPDGTVVGMSTESHRTAFVDPADMRLSTAPWPKELTQGGEVVIGYGGITGGGVAVWSLNNWDGRQAVYARLLDHAGRLTRTTAVPVAQEPGYSLLDFDGTDANLEQSVFPAAVSPDGRFLAAWGMVIDTTACRASTFDGDDWIGGWYGADQVLRSQRNVPAKDGHPARPMTLGAFTPDGRRTAAVPLSSLPGHGDGQGFAKVFTAAAGPATADAIRI